MTTPNTHGRQWFFQKSEILETPKKDDAIDGRNMMEGNVAIVWWQMMLLPLIRFREILKNWGLRWFYILLKSFDFSLALPRRRQWQPTPVLLPGKSHGWRSLVGCSPWGREESDMTERLHFHLSLSRIVKGNGNPLQCSCLENPRNGGAWWAAVYGAAQSWTWLKWLISSWHYLLHVLKMKPHVPWECNTLERKFSQWLYNKKKNHKLL